jgi:wyosine [tRNA(Phe)-imidazoG37] synthetase (radical SAM superfamily)
MAQAAAGGSPKEHLRVADEPDHVAPATPTTIEAAWRRHERRWADNLYVYAVISRRSRGLSVGINLNPDKACNFDCIYCQVDRTVAPRVRKVDLDRLSIELDHVLEAARDGWLFDAPPLDALPADERVVRDIAFSGDGEPTTSPLFPAAVALVAERRRRFGLDHTKIVLITDAAYLSKPAVREALAVLDQNNGEIWAKLDAGTEEYFRLVDRPNVSLDIVMANLLDAARVRPVVIQTLWLRVNGVAPPASEVDAYCGRLRSLVDGGGQVKGVQLYTIARRPAEAIAGALSRSEIDAVAAQVRACANMPVDVFYGVTD